MSKRLMLGFTTSLLVLATAALLGPGAMAQIDPPPSTCVFGEGGNCFHDTNPCTIDQCNPTTGQCEHVAMTCSPDDNLCTTETCDPTTGTCKSGAPKSCTAEGGGDIDHDLCTQETCQPSTGQCVSGAPRSCMADDNLCTTESCNPATGQCASGPPKSCTAEGGGMDGNNCTQETCNPATGQCQPGEGTSCEQDDNLCTVEACNPTSGSCESSTAKSCEQDDNLCNTEACVPSTGQCESGEDKSCEGDADNCTTEVCDPTTGECSSEPENPAPDGCGGAICRTPGFWGTHAGTEKNNSINITQLVINAAIGQSLSVCGESITSTIVNDDASAVEAICVPVQGTARLQLARQLTAAALNCVVSDGDADCSSTPLYASIFADCDAICTNSGSSGASITSCVDRIDCLNNGGKVLANGSCQTGTCSGAGHAACGEKAPCMDGSACVALDGNCHSQEIANTALGLNFPSTGAAGSPKACNSANGSPCVVIGSGQSGCPY